MTYVLAAGRVCPPGPPAPGWIAIDGGLIVEVGSGPAPGGAVDTGSALLAPGFIDLQVNGVDDVDFVSTDVDGWRRAGRAQLEEGVTSYCPTLVTAPLDEYPPALDASSRLAPSRRANRFRASSAPTSRDRSSAARPARIPSPLSAMPSASGYVRSSPAFPGVVAIVTLAPEADPGFAATRLLGEHGVTVALGHSTATYETARAAADAGARLVTHLFNGMGPLHHRQPGLAGAALDDERLTPTLIADLVHVHAAALRLAIRHKHSVGLVTDRVATTGLRVTGDGAALLADGTLAGSTLSMARAVQNTVALGIPVERAVEMAATIPADALGVTDRGRIAPGMRADLVALDPNSLVVRAVWLGGEPVVGSLAPG